MKAQATFLCLVLLCFFEHVYPQTKVDYQNILTNLFTTNSYNKKVIPNDNFTEPVFVDISLSFLGINEIDELEEKFVTTGYLTIGWHDGGLSWDPSAYSDIPRIYVPQDDIWKPDIVLANGFKRFEELGGKFYYILVDSSGFVTWQPFEVFQSRCALDTSNYPFDSQTCNVTFVVWSHSIEEIEITKSTNGIVFNEWFQENAVWEIVSTDFVVARGDWESRIFFSFKLKRKPLYYVINLVLPVIFLGLLNGLVFVIPSETGEKTGFSITVFLSLAVFLTIVSSLLPTNSDNTSILGVYLLLQVIYGVVVLFLTTVQLRICHKGESVPVSGGYLKFTRFSRSLRCATRSNRQVKDSDKVMELKKEEMKEMEEDDTPVSWSEVVSEMDYVFFWFFLILYTLTTIVVFAVMLIKF